MNCTGCFEETSRDQTLVSSCSHVYCIDCLERLFKSSLACEQDFPPKCCRRPIPLDPALKLVSGDTTKKYLEKLIEFGTPARDRVYCHAANCSAFIPLQAKGQTTTITTTTQRDVRCPKCATKTCRLCGHTAHGKASCPRDDGRIALNALAKKQEWKQCGNCRTFVDRVDGCDFIMCLCGYDFCYRCGGPWPDCGCTNWEHRWLVGQHPEGRGLAPARPRQEPAPAPAQAPARAPAPAPAQAEQRPVPEPAPGPPRDRRVRGFRRGYHWFGRLCFNIVLLAFGPFERDGEVPAGQGRAAAAQRPAA